MHSSVIEFRNRLFNYAKADAIPAPALREELLYLHNTVVDERSRVELMRLFDVIADIVQAHLEREGQDVEAFRLHRHAQIWQFLRAESLVDGMIDRDGLLTVTSREVAAGRLSETEEIHLYALGDDQAFDHILTSTDAANQCADGLAMECRSILEGGDLALDRDGIAGVGCARQLVAPRIKRTVPFASYRSRSCRSPIELVTASGASISSSMPER